MRWVITFLICFFICILVAILPFKYTDLTSFATVHQIIATYGTYLSGTLPPIISIFALAGVLITLKQQQAMIQENERSIQSLEIRHALELCDTELSKKAAINPFSLDLSMTLAEGSTIELGKVSYHDVLNTIDVSIFASHIFLKKSEYKNLKIDNKRYWERVKQGTMLTSIEMDLARMSSLMKTYKELNGNQAPLLVSYYTKYKLMYENMVKLEFISVDKNLIWKESSTTSKDDN